MQFPANIEDLNVIERTPDVKKKSKDNRL